MKTLTFGMGLIFTVLLMAIFCRELLADLGACVFIAWCVNKYLTEGEKQNG